LRSLLPFVHCKRENQQAQHRKLIISSARPRERRSSTTVGFSFRVVLQPNNLVSSRCSNLVKSSQLIVAALVHARR
jgi:hypothetical protein